MILIWCDEPNGATKVHSHPIASLSYLTVSLKTLYIGEFYSV